MGDYFEDEKNRYNPLANLPADKKIIEDLDEVESVFSRAIAPAIKKDQTRAIALSSVFLGLSAASGLFLQIPLKGLLSRSPDLLLALEMGSLAVSTLAIGGVSCIQIAECLDTLSLNEAVKRGIGSSRLDGFKYVRLIVPKNKKDPSLKEVEALTFKEKINDDGDFFWKVKKQYQRKHFKKSVLMLGALGLTAFTSAFVYSGKKLDDIIEKKAASEQAAPAMIEN